jgi:hypothetical protein
MAYQGGTAAFLGLRHRATPNCGGDRDCQNEIFHLCLRVSIAGIIAGRPRKQRVKLEKVPAEAAPPNAAHNLPLRESNNRSSANRLIAPAPPSRVQLFLGCRVDLRGLSNGTSEQHK